MEQNTKTGKPTESVVLPHNFSGKTLATASAEHGVLGLEEITMIVIPPFEAVYLSEDGKHVVWEKDFTYRGEKNITRAVFVEYLSYLMPELYNVSCGWLGDATIAWATPDAETLTLAEGAANLSAEALRLINGETTIDQLWDALYTDDNIVKIDALVRSTRLEADEIIRTIMNGHSVSLAQGEL